MHSWCFGEPVTAHIKEDSGLPWGAIVQPFCDLDRHLHVDTLNVVKRGRKCDADTIFRCEECYGLVNPLWVRSFRRCAGTCVG